MTITTSFVGRPNFTPRPYLTLQFFVYRFDRLASTVPYHLPFQTVKPRTELFKTEFYTRFIFYYKPFTVPSKVFDRFSSSFFKREPCPTKKLTVYRFVLEKRLPNHIKNGKRLVCEN